MKGRGEAQSCWRARFFCSSPSVGLSCWSVSGARGPWPAAAICSELVLRHHSMPSLLVSPANVWSFKLTFCVHSVYSRLCTDTNLWFFGAGRSCRSGGVGGGAGGRQTHSYFSFFFLGRFSIHLQKNIDFNIKAIKHVCISSFCWTQKYIFWRVLRTGFCPRWLPNNASRWNPESV